MRTRGKSNISILKTNPTTYLFHHSFPWCGPQQFCHSDSALTIAILHSSHTLCSRYTDMEVTSFCSSSRAASFVYSYPSKTTSTKQSLHVYSMAAEKSPPSAAKTVGSKKVSSYISRFSSYQFPQFQDWRASIVQINSTVFPLGEKGPRSSISLSTSPPIKLLTRVEQLKLLSKAEKAGLLSAAEKAGLSLSSIEKLGLLSKAEELGILSAATDPGTPGALLSLSLGLLLLGPSCVYLVPEDNVWEIVLQVAVALVSVVGGSAAFAASNLVSNLQRSNWISALEFSNGSHGSCSDQYQLSFSFHVLVLSAAIIEIYHFPANWNGDMWTENSLPSILYQCRYKIIILTHTLYNNVIYSNLLLSNHYVMHFC